MILIRAIQEVVIDAVVQQYGSPFNSFIPDTTIKYGLTPENKRININVEAIRNLCKKVLKDRMATIKESDPSSLFLLDSLVSKISEEYTIEMVADDLLGLAFAGFDTTSRALVSVIWMLHKNPECL